MNARRSRAGDFLELVERASDVRLLREGEGNDLHVVSFESPKEERRP
jgi:two-component system sensor histidine kinase KdpD